MKTNTMRVIDRLVGSPACHLLALLKPLFVRKPLSQPAKKTVVLCKFFGLGSICLSYPLIRELERLDYDITYLTFKANDPLIKMIGIKNTICIDPTSLPGFITGVTSAIFRMRHCRPEVFLNLEFFSRFAAIMTLLSGAPVRAGFHISHLPIGKLFTHHTNLNVYRPIYENYLNVGMSAGILEKLTEYSPDSSTITLPEPDVFQNRIQSPYYVINAESSETIQVLRSWPTESWAKLIDQLRHENPEVMLVLIGTTASVKMYKRILDAVRPDTAIINLAGQTSFKEMVDLVSGADRLITVDSGPFHIGALLKCPTVGLFGPETPVLYGYDLPWVRNIYENLICSPCLALYDAKKSVLNCSDNQCMKLISVPKVVAAINSFNRLSETTEPKRSVN
jgi:heptosyltransferase-3